MAKVARTTRCKRTTKSGKRCRAPAWGGDGYCGLHHPKNQERIAEGRRKGGLTTQRRLKANDLGNINLDTVEGVEAAIVTVALNLAKGQISEERARALTSIFKLKIEMTDVRRLEVKIIELEDANEKDRPT